MAIETSPVHIEAMLCELLQLAREGKGESTFSGEPRDSTEPTRLSCVLSPNGPANEGAARTTFSDEPITPVKRARSESGSSCGRADSTGTSEGINENSECMKGRIY